MLKAEKIRQTSVQAEILAASIAAPLAFDDSIAVQEYLAALRKNPDIQAAGAYDDEGRLMGQFSLSGALPPKTGRFLARSEEHTSELQSLMRISYAVFCLKNKNKQQQ